MNRGMICLGGESGSEDGHPVAEGRSPTPEPAPDEPENDHDDPDESVSSSDSESSPEPKIRRNPTRVRKPATVFDMEKLGGSATLKPVRTGKK